MEIQHLNLFLMMEDVMKILLLRKENHNVKLQISWYDSSALCCKPKTIPGSDGYCEVKINSQDCSKVIAGNNPTFYNNPNGEKNDFKYSKVYLNNSCVDPSSSDMELQCTKNGGLNGMKGTWFPKDRTGNYGKGVCCPDSLVFNKEVGYCVSKPVCQYFEYPLNSKIWYPNQYQQNSNQAICQNSFDISGNDASRNSYLKDMCTTGNAIIKPPVCSNYGQNFKCGIEVQDYVVNNGTVANKGFNFVFTRVVFVHQL